MKNNKIIILLSTIIMLLIGIIFYLMIEKTDIIREKQIIKEMNQSTLEEELNNSINKLNIEQTEYWECIQTCKTKIATALTNEGVETSDEILLEDMAENISKVLAARTSNADATADNITAGKTAYVNGELITGTGADNDTYYNQGAQSVSKKSFTVSAYGYSGTADYNTVKVRLSLAACEGCTSIKGSHAFTTIGGTSHTYQDFVNAGISTIEVSQNFYGSTDNTKTVSITVNY